MDRVFGILIKSVNHELDRNADQFAQTFGLTRMQISIIDYLARRENDQDIFQRDIEEEFNIRRASATSALKLMEKKDLIVRAPMADDARLKRIVLTLTSRKLTAEINRYFENTEAIVNDIVGSDKMQTVRDSLDKIAKHFNK